MELLLDESTIVRRTRLVHVQTGHKDYLAGLGRDPPVGLRDQAVWTAYSSGQRRRAMMTSIWSNRLLRAVARVNLSPFSEPPARLAGEMHVRELSAWPSGADRPRSLLRHDQPFSVRLTLDLSNIVAPPNAPVDCAVTIHAKSLSGRGRQVVGQARDPVTMPSQEVELHVNGTGLAEDVYRLQAAVTIDLVAPGMLASPGTVCLYQGPIIAVY